MATRYFSAALCGVSVLVLSGCMSVPERTPDLTVASMPDWSAEFGEYRARLQPSNADTAWWLVFDDPALNALIEAAQADNLNLAQLSARIREARASLYLTVAGARPMVGLSGAGSALHLSENGQIPAGSFPGFPVDQTLFSVGFDASWEIDLFGRQALREELGAYDVSLQEERLRDARLSLTAELTRAWVELQSVRAERALLTEDLSRQQAIVDMVATRREYGEASDVDVERAEMRIMQTSAQSPTLDMRERLARNQIAMLTGRAPSELALSDVPTRPLPPPDVFVSDNVLTDLLSRRPDVRSAERRYAMLARQLDLTRLELYPSLRLVGSVGPEVRDLTDILSPESLAANIGAMASWTLFDGGRGELREQVYSAQLEAAEAAYSAAVLTAINDVENAAARYGETLNLVQHLEALLASSERLTDYAAERYEGGTGTLLQVTEAERDQIEIQRQLTTARRDALFALIALYKALGGPP